MRKNNNNYSLSIALMFDLRFTKTLYLRFIDIQDFRWHDLRSTYAVYLAMNGTPLILIQKLLGHKTLSMTLRYSQFSNELMTREAVDKLKFTEYNASEDRTLTAHRVMAND